VATTKKPEKTEVQKLLAESRKAAGAGRFLFYPGQKGTILERIATLIPRSAKRMIEPFTGSGVVASGLAFRFESIQASDAIPALVAAHNQAAFHPDAFVSEIEKLFFARGDGTKSRFLAARRRYNAARTPPEEKAALLIFLNRRAALGLVRHNEDGDLNISWHKSKSKSLPPTEQIREFSKRLGDKAEFSIRDFRAAIADAGPGDFVYCDPPYMPEEGKPATFTGYSEPFDIKAHADLAALAAAAAERGATVVVSNHDSPSVREVYASATTIHSLDVDRKADRKKGKKAKMTAREVLAIWRPKADPGRKRRRSSLPIGIGIPEIMGGVVADPAQRTVRSEAPEDPPRRGLSWGGMQPRREHAIEPFSVRADLLTLDRLAFDRAVANGWLKPNARRDRISFHSFNETGRYLLTIARRGTPAMRRLALERPGREAYVSLHLLDRVCRGSRGYETTWADAEIKARALLDLSEGLALTLANTPGGGRVTKRALKFKAEAFWNGIHQDKQLPGQFEKAMKASGKSPEDFPVRSLQIKKLPQRYKAALEAIAARRWKANSEVEHRLLLLAELCPDADTRTYARLCQKVAEGLSPKAFLDAMPSLKSGASHGVAAEAHVVMETGAVRKILEALRG